MEIEEISCVWRPLTIFSALSLGQMTRRLFLGGKEDALVIKNKHV